MVSSSRYTQRSPGQGWGTDSLSCAHALTLDHPCGVPGRVPPPRGPGPCPAGLAPSAGRVALGSGTSQEEEPRAQGTTVRPLSFSSSCLTAPFYAQAGFPLRVEQAEAFQCPLGACRQLEKGGCSFPEQRGRVCLQRPGLRRRDGTEPPVLGTDSAALTSSLAFLVHYL